MTAVTILQAKFSLWCSINNVKGWYVSSQKISNHYTLKRKYNIIMLPQKKRYHDLWNCYFFNNHYCLQLLTKRLAMMCWVKQQPSISDTYTKFFDTQVAGFLAKYKTDGIHQVWLSCNITAPHLTLTFTKPLRKCYTFSVIHVTEWSIINYLSHQD